MINLSEIKEMELTQTVVIPVFATSDDGDGQYIEAYSISFLLNDKLVIQTTCHLDREDNRGEEDYIPCSDEQYYNDDVLQNEVHAKFAKAATEIVAAIVDNNEINFSMQHFSECETEWI